jgi:peptidoglycan/LPS O-acetylase OafA/YrhL
MKWELQGIGNAYVAVDTFFLISGMLVCYMLLREFDRCRTGVQKLVNVLLGYVHRYLR